MSALDAPPNAVLAAPKNIRWVLLGVLLAMLLSQLDGLIVGTAMPTIVASIGGLDHISWVVTAYTLTTACSTPVWGKVGDLYNRKLMFLLSIVVFMIGSALSGQASSMGELIGFRALQGVGAGGLMAGAFAPSSGCCSHHASAANTRAWWPSSRLLVASAVRWSAA